MFDVLIQGLWVTLLIVLASVVVFAVYILWKVRPALKNLFRAIREAWIKSKNDSYSRAEMINSVRIFEREGNTKSANFWRQEIIRKFPNDPYFD